MTNVLPWIEKYRPKTVEDIVSHDKIISVMNTLYVSRTFPHLLFVGPPGTGKTSTIMAFAKQLYGKYYDYMVMELNASDDRGIDVVRNKIKRFVSTDTSFFGTSVKERTNIFKLVILDEVDAMTNDAQAILRKIVENYTINVRFCLICNYVHNIIPALQSRCTLFKFSPIPKHDIVKKIKYVVEQEKLEISNCALDVVIKKSGGDMRKILNILQSVSMAYDNITKNEVNICMGYPNTDCIVNILNYLTHLSYNESYNHIKKIIKDNGICLSDIITDIHDIIFEYLTTNVSEYSNIMKYSVKSCLEILYKLKYIENNVAYDSNTNIQIGILIGIFITNRPKIEK